MPPPGSSRWKSSGCRSPPTARSRRRRGCWPSAKGMHYRDPDGRKVLDGTSGLWCVNAGHCRRADRRGDPALGGDAGLRPGLPDGASVELRPRPRAGGARPRGPRPRLLRQLRVGGGGLGAEDRPRLPAGARRAGAACASSAGCAATTGWASAASRVGGIESNRKAFAAQLLPHVDHLPHTHDLAHNAFSRGQPAHGARSWPTRWRRSSPGAAPAPSPR